MKLRLAGCALVLSAAAGWAQSFPSATFRNATTESDWKLGGSAVLTARDIDFPRRGWLRLTGTTHNSLGSAHYEGTPIDVSQGFSLSFEYVAWGGGQPGADGISVYLFDGTRDMAGAIAGGGLGYCRGNGGWLALGLDEYGNFSHFGDSCGSGPGQRPQSLVVRGPVAAGHPLAVQVNMPGNVDWPTARQRPQPSRVKLQAVPVAPEPGYLLTVDVQEAGGPWMRLVDRARFPHPAPATVRIGVAGATGGLFNIHEVRDVSLRPFAEVRIGHSFNPSVMRVGEQTRLQLSLSSATSPALLDKPLTVFLPPGVKVAAPSQLGGSCRGSILAAPEADHLVIEAGTRLPEQPCTFSVEVRALAAGRWAHDIPAGSVVSDWGYNLQPSSAVLSVQ